MEQWNLFLIFFVVFIFFSCEMLLLGLNHPVSCIKRLYVVWVEATFVLLFFSVLFYFSLPSYTHTHSQSTCWKEKKVRCVEHQWVKWVKEKLSCIILKRQAWCLLNIKGCYCFLHERDVSLFDEDIFIFSFLKK